jgi:nitronate monooxygenase
MTNTLKKNTSLCDILNIKYPIIMAPMFLVSNEDMLVEAIKAGITGCVPALNYRTDGQLLPLYEIA